MSSLYERIRLAANGSDIADAALSKKAGLHRESVRQIKLRCEKSPNAAAGVETIDKLARTLDVSFRWLATGKGEPGAYDASEVQTVASARALAETIAIQLHLPAAAIQSTLDDFPGLDDPSELVSVMITRRGGATAASAPSRKRSQSA